MGIDTNIGILMKYDAFNTLVEKYLSRMREGEDFDSDEHLELVRIWNTIESNQLSEVDKLFQEYSERYVSKYLQISATKLDATVTKGMCFYSQKHDVFIGGKPHQNSQYKLERVKISSEN